MLNLNLNLKLKKWLVLGGGVVATRRIKKILSAGGEIEVISPQITPTISKLKLQNKDDTTISGGSFSHLRGFQVPS